MSFHPKGSVCIAISQDSMYAVVLGNHSNGKGDFIGLIKAENPNTVRNNTWTVVSTTPANYFETYGGIYSDLTTIGPDWKQGVTCDVDRNLVFTLRFPSGAGFRYIPWAPKVSRAQTCTSAIPGTDRVANNKTLLYFPFDPFDSKRAQASA
ncbi:hypothetical protein BG005_005759 [Podila minutissima]|nr:hypothetical protein BG005_005759 [Podila minutissima]